MAQAAIPYHRKVAQTPRRELAHHWMRRGKFWLLPLLLSDYGREIIDHKYDAFVTDRAYENVPSGLLGPVGQLIDYVVLQQDIHVGLRQRLQLVVEESAHVVRTLWAQGHPQVRMVSAPCGLARDLRAIWQQLDRPTAARLRVHGLDLDERGDVLPTAQTLANAIGMPLRTSRCDLLNTGQCYRTLNYRPAHLLLSVGLTVWLTASQRGALLLNYYDLLAPGGTLIIDLFHAHGASRFAAALEMEVHYPKREAFVEMLDRCGFRVEYSRTTPNRVNTLFVCRRQ